MATIAREHYEAVFRFCARRVGMDRASDVAQETFLTAQKALSKFRGESTLSTWLIGIAHNECRRASRQMRTEPLLLEIDPARPSSERAEETLVDREALRVALAKLSEDHREVVVMHEIDGLTYEEIAAIVGVPIGTVKSRLHHAFMNLRKALLPAEEVR
ncbi:MAG: RNA polymerase sigma factor [Fimbriimonas sp.]